MNKIWTEEEIKSKLIEGNKIWIEHAVIAIFNKQTSYEQSAETTKERNCVGYNGADAPIMSSFAKQLIRRKGYHLSEKQLYVAKKKIVKYVGQLTIIANGGITKAKKTKRAIEF